jgi:heterodisulfide reductase subunit A-like polyferredoxin
MNTVETQGYILTFRCVNCGKHEVFAKYPSEDIIAEDQIRARIYQVRCRSCGWTGDACGLSAIHISHTTELKARIAGQAN